MRELYVLVVLDKDGKFVKYVRKGRNNSISGYDDLSSAKRGLSQTKSQYGRYHEGRNETINIIEMVVK